MSRTIRVYRPDERGQNKVHVLKRQCRTCIFWPDERRGVSPETTAYMQAQCERKNTIIPCHEHMETETPVVCRGLFNTRAVGMLQVAERLGAIVFDDLGDGPDFRAPTETT